MLFPIGTPVIFDLTPTSTPTPISNFATGSPTKLLFSGTITAQATNTAAITMASPYGSAVNTLAQGDPFTCVDLGQINVSCPTGGQSLCIRGSLAGN